MNSEASQTPEPIDERLAEKQEQNNAVEHPLNQSVESVGETGAISSSENYTTFEPLISNAEVVDSEVVDSTVELTENSNGEFVAQSEPENTALGSENYSLYAEAEQRVAELQSAEAALKEEIAKLQAFYKNLQAQVGETQTSLGRLVQESLVQLEQRKQTLQISVEQLERRQERIRNEMRTTFAGTSQDLAIRVQGFKDYLTVATDAKCGGTRKTICKRKGG
jgi:multidrug efflux pump subunit AcrA (membrane-fusion protein)